MRDIILMADGARKVYSVPEAAAENLEKYCLDFCDKSSMIAQLYLFNTAIF